MEVSDEEKVSPRQIVDQYMLKISDDSADDLDVWLTFFIKTSAEVSKNLNLSSQFECLV